jgi:hypothetical protein
MVFSWGERQCLRCVTRYLLLSENPGKYQTILSPRPILYFQRATNEYIATTFSALSTRARGLEEDAHNGLSGWENWIRLKLRTQSHLLFSMNSPADLKSSLPVSKGNYYSSLSFSDRSHDISPRKIPTNTTPLVSYSSPSIHTSIHQFLNLPPVTPYPQKRTSQSSTYFPSESRSLLSFNPSFPPFTPPSTFPNPVDLVTSACGSGCLAGWSSLEVLEAVEAEDCESSAGEDFLPALTALGGMLVEGASAV